MKNRIVFGLITLSVAAIIAIVALMLRGQLGEVIPFKDAQLWANNVTQPLYLVAQRLYIVGYSLPLFGLWAIYAYLAKNDRSEKYAFWGFMTGIFGTTLALPTLGALTYAASGFGQLYLQGQISASQYVLDFAMKDSMVLGIPAAVLYSLSSILFGIALLRSNKIPKLLAYTFMPHGAFLSFGFGFYPLIYLAWIIYIICGVWIALIVSRDN